MSKRIGKPIAGWKLIAGGFASIAALPILVLAGVPMGDLVALGLFASWVGLPMLIVGTVRLLRTGAVRLHSQSDDGAPLLARLLLPMDLRHPRPDRSYPFTCPG
jgi:hypothetical protein